MSTEVEVQGGVTLVTWRRPGVRNAVDASTASTSTLRRRRAAVTASRVAGIGGRPRMLAEALRGASRFAAGQVRHGQF